MIYDFVISKTTFSEMDHRQLIARDSFTDSMFGQFGEDPDYLCSSVGGKQAVNE